MAKLTERGVQTAKTGRHGDGDGLQLVVGENGRKKWVLRYQVEWASGATRASALSPGWPQGGALKGSGRPRGLIVKGVDRIERPAAKERLRSQFRPSATSRNSS